MATEFQKKKAKEICEKYGVKLSLRIKNYAGTADYRKNVVSVNSDLTKDSFFSALFHEIGHIHCYRNKIWAAYHYDVETFTEELFNEYKRTAFEAECWIDKWAEEEMKKCFPKLPYFKAFDFETRQGEEYLDNHNKKFYKQASIFFNSEY